MVVIAGALVMMTDTRDMTDIILEAEIVEAAVETGEATVKTGEAEVETGEAAVGIIEVEAEIAGAGVQCPGEGDTGIRDDGRYVHARKSRDTSKIQSERLAVLKKLTNDGNSSDEEEGAIGTTGSSGIQSETVFTAGADEVDEKEIMRVMGFGGFDSTKEKPVEDNFKGAALGAAAKNKRRIYRQYMNRRGGFNRPLQKLD
eukprot:CAMPEP_0185021336 /NCGR_PEP_ID=MMETSP1103-20130426/4027_1 /TAXON_ID=36769 /ORGANISM="Paraphysomonas bandaiensis, Strain Caron Lab Isolate" /LENGTH=200 /DNA_ID=CAMNT_0027552799 /DNA_START=88 /DNA_END=689 /DNA_ORIENTATION=-